MASSNNDEDSLNLDTLKRLCGAHVPTDVLILNIQINHGKFHNFLRTNLSDDEIIEVLKILGRLCHSFKASVTNEKFNTLRIFINDTFITNTEIFIKHRSNFCSPMKLKEIWSDLMHFCEAILTDSEAFHFGFSALKTIISTLMGHLTMFTVVFKKKNKVKRDITKIFAQILSSMKNECPENENGLGCQHREQLFDYFQQLSHIWKLEISSESIDKKRQSFGHVNLKTLRNLCNMRAENATSEVLSKYEIFRHFLTTDLTDEKMILLLQLLQKICKSVTSSVTKQTLFVLKLFLNDEFVVNLKFFIESLSKRNVDQGNSNLEDIVNNMLSFCEVINNIMFDTGYDALKIILGALIIHFPISKIRIENQLSMVIAQIRTKEERSTLQSQRREELFEYLNNLPETELLENHVDDGAHAEAASNGFRNSETTIDLKDPKTLKVFSEMHPSVIVTQIRSNYTAFRDFLRTDLDREEIILVLKLLLQVCHQFLKKGKKEIVAFKMFLNEEFISNLKAFIESLSGPYPHQRIRKFNHRIQTIWMNLLKFCKVINNEAFDVGYNALQAILGALINYYPVFKRTHKMGKVMYIKNELTTLITQILPIEPNNEQRQRREEIFEYLRQLSVFVGHPEILEYDADPVSIERAKNQHFEENANSALDWEMLEVIVNKGVKKLILGIQRNREKFSTYSKQNLNYDEMTMIVKIFGKACQEHEISKRNDVIKIFLHDTFIENLGEFLVNCLNQPQKTYNVISTSVLEHVLNICEAICCFDANHSALQTILKSITTLTPAFEKGRYNKYSKQIREKVRALSSKVDLTGKGDNQNTKCLESNYGRGVCDLNESQMAAFQAATTQKFTIIRGPPATGKTHLGLQIVKTFLDRKHLWHKRTPILIVCSSDGALDTILEGVATFTSKILRVGGHLKNIRLSRFTLQDLSKREQNVAAEVKTVNEKLEEIDGCRSILGFNEFAEVTPNTWFYNAGDDQILQWLLANKESGSNVQKKKTWSKISFSTPERGTRAIVSLKCLQQEINRLEQATRKQKRQLNKKLSHLKDKHKILTERLAEGKRFKDVADQRPTNTNLTNPEEMQPDDRWKLYFYWLKLYQNELMRKLASFQNKKNDKIDYAVAEIMKDALVVGVTAAKAIALRSSLFSLKSPIVIVEDAADISEAQIVTGMVKHCQHLILFGDHRPTTDDSNGLFEKIDSDLSQHYVLNVQYRMRPEISSLLSTVYPSLKDHHSVTARAPVKGMDKCLFFLDRDSDSEVTTIRTGKINCEIELFVCLAKYLVSNGYKSKRIAIVAACLGQMDEFRNAITKHGDLQGVRISDLGNYQAGENEIILLYLMPSSGILLSDRRICFTISRARSGLYVMGNMKQLCHDNEFWVDIKATLQELSAIGQELPLKPLSCIHGQNTVSYVKSAADFIAVSQKSCDKKCEIMPPCGHQCNRLCHVQDVAHAEYKCKEICGRPRCDLNHIFCQKKCYQKCDPCTFKVQRHLQCGHTVQIKCYQNTSNTTIKCPFMVNVELPCGHMAEKPCHSDANNFQCPHPCEKKLPCGHVCGLSCHIRTDPKHLRYKCKRRCTRYNTNCTTKEEGHKCRKLCFQDCDECEILVRKQCTSCLNSFEIACSGSINEVKCGQPCVKILKCGHQCQKKCHEECGDCAIKVTKINSVCGHSMKVKCSEKQNQKYCHQKCLLTLPCGHRCDAKCNEPCTVKCVKMVNCLKMAKCGHIVTQIHCNMLQKSVFLQDNFKLPLKFCHKRCDVTLECGHRCSGSCRECHQGRVHKKCFCSDYLKKMQKQVAMTTPKENEGKRRDLHRKIFELNKTCEVLSAGGCCYRPTEIFFNVNDRRAIFPKIRSALAALDSQLLKWRKQQKRICTHQLEIVTTKLEIIESIIHLSPRNPKKYFFSQVDFVLDVLKREHHYFTNQEAEDVSFELNRLARIVDFSRIEHFCRLFNSSPGDNVKQINTEIEKCITDCKRFSEGHNDHVKELLKEVNKALSSRIHISQDKFVTATLL